MNDTTIEKQYTPRFSLGQTVMTPGVAERIPESEIHGALRQHQFGDWGCVPKEDREENELALKEGFRLLSAYESKSGERFWIITEADRSSTTVLLPEEY